jgi:phosphopantetheinyl transferase (holo-ACP synthase)
LPYTGNDIVDLIRQPNGQKSKDSRFLKKILTDTEIGQVCCSGNPEVALWSFWVCKEAAYKVVRKKDNRAAFLPGRWSVRYRDFQDSPEYHPSLQSGSREGEVVIPGSGNVYVRLFTFPSYVHCIASDTTEGMNRIVARVDRLPRPKKSLHTDPSIFVRSKLLHCLARHLHLPARDMKIVRESQKDGLGPPLLYIAGVESAVDLSISHDGCYVAYAYLA